MMVCIKCLILLLFAMSLNGCKKWEYDVIKNGLHFTKISQSNEGPFTGKLSENTIVRGLPCKRGWIHFRKDWRLLSCQLSEDFQYRQLLIPEGSWFHFPYHTDRTGFIISFPYDYKVQGYVCDGSGGYKGTHTGFYDSGRLRGFFAAEDTVVDGVPCAASLFVSIRLFESGAIKRCKLSNTYQAGSRVFKKGDIIRFEESGSPVPEDISEE